MPPLLSIVVPAYNEAESLVQLHAELSDVAAANRYELEILFVDDGSRDHTWEVINKLAEQDARVQGIRFRRNFGKAAALSAGFAAARGDIIFTLDADLQDDPHEIPQFLEALAAGNDVISGWKQVRHDPWHKTGPSRIFNWLVSRLTGVKLHDHNCGFKCYRREIFDEVRIYGELHRFVPVLAAARGWKVGEVVVNHRRRRHGYSKYGFTRFVKGFLDLLTVLFLTGFQERPQHLLGTVGLTSFCLGAVGMTYFAGYWICSQVYPEWGLTPLHQRPAVLYSVGLLLFGGQLLSMGFLAELITAMNSRGTSNYSIREHVGGSAAKESRHAG